MKTQHFSVLGPAITQLVYAIVLIAWFSACTTEDVAPVVTPDLTVEENKYLVESSLIQKMTGAEVARLAANSPGIPSLLSLLSFEDIEIHKIIYKTTDISGNTIKVSGALAFPQKVGDRPLISYQHGTITSDAGAPSNFGANTNFHLLGALSAGRGYVIAAPDYIGYGVSAATPHPYEHAATLGQTATDIIYAVQEFFEDKSTNLNDKLFLTGYSEGGYATMAMQQNIEENTELKVTLSALGLVLTTNSICQIYLATRQNAPLYEYVLVGIRYLQQNLQHQSTYEYLHKSTLCR